MALCATLGACGDDSGSATGDTDAGLIDTRPVDTGQAATDSGAGASGPRLTLVNATYDLGPNAAIGASAAIRLCFKQGSVVQNLSVAPVAPVPELAVAGSPPGKPGLYYGTGVKLPYVGVDFAGRIVVPIVMNVRSLDVGASATCDQLVGDAADAGFGEGLRENVDYWTLPRIEVGSLANGKSYILALTGCVADAAPLNPGKCGVGFVIGGGPGRGNLALTIYETRPPATPTPAQLGAQFLYLSTQANAFYSQATAKGSIQPGFVSNAIDGGGFRPVTNTDPPIGILAGISAVTNVTDGDSFVLGPRSLNPSEAARGTPLLPSSLLAIQAYSGLGPSSGASLYRNGGSYVFIGVGDPDLNETKPFVNGTPGGDGGDGSRFNSRFFHFLAYPTAP